MMRTRTVPLLGAVVLVAALVVIAISGRATPATTRPDASPTNAAVGLTPAPPSASPSALSEPSATREPTPSAVTTRAQFDDKPGDVQDQNGDPVPSGRPAADIVRLVVEARDGVLDLNIDTAQAPPLGDDPLAREHQYGWRLAVTSDDGMSDWQVVVGNTIHPEDANVPGWVGQATSFADSQTRFGRAFPGTIRVEGTRINVRLPLDAIGAIGDIRVAGFSVDATSAGGHRNVHQDSAPDNRWPEWSSWVTVRP